MIYNIFNRASALVYAALAALRVREAEASLAGSEEPWNNMNADCIFCKIIAKEIPNYTVCEDDQTLAFLDIHPHAKGHTVVIPKVHAEEASKLSDEQMSSVFLAVKKAMAKIESALSPDGYNVGWNDRPTAGQVVPHMHVHIMPRWEGDGGGSMHSIVKQPGDLPVSEVAKLF